MNENLKNILENNKEKILEIPTRKGFGEGLLLLGKNNPQVVALSADLTDSTQVESFKKAYPNRFFEIGVSEQNMASVASGMASMGKIPFITSYAMFSPGRNWEQIRTTIAYNNVPVKIVGCHAGISVGPDGGTHQALEDIALMRVIPNMTVIVPCDAIEAKKAAIKISETKNPTYLRLFREKSPVLTAEDSPFEIGKINLVYKTEKATDRKVLVLACGEMVSKVLFIAKKLEKENISLIILNVHTIKPLDSETIKKYILESKNILVAEEHQISGGLGSAVLEALATENLLEGLKIKLVGVEDRFGQSGKKDELYKEYGLDEDSLFKKILNF
jgi:transketolase